MDVDYRDSALLKNERLGFVITNADSSRLAMSYQGRFGVMLSVDRIALEHEQTILKVAGTDCSICAISWYDFITDDMPIFFDEATRTVFMANGVLSEKVHLSEQDKNKPLDSRFPYFMERHVYH